MNSQHSNLTNNSHIKSPRKQSVLDNKETFLHFSNKSRGTKEDKQSFISAYYKRKNLRLADKLAHSKKADNKAVNQAIRNLRFCSSMATVEIRDNGKGLISKSSITCKNPHCAICSRARSTKLSIRFLNAMKDTANKDIFKDKYYYFVTLTLKHNESTRNTVYLRELNSYCNRLFRSKKWGKYFGNNKGEVRAGRIHCRECTFTKNGYHIHAHVICGGPRIKQKIKEVESELRQVWEKITKDSTGLRIDLLNLKNETGPSENITQMENRILCALKELVKYGSKTGAVAKWSGKDVDKYADWIIETKGKNFINVSGIFRGLGLTGSKSKYDSKPDEKVYDPTSKYYACKTSQLMFSHPTHIDYSNKKRKQVLDNVFLQALPSSAVDVTDHIEHFDEYLRIGLIENELERFIPEWSQFLKNKMGIVDESEEIKEMREQWLLKKEAAAKLQIKLFEDDYKKKEQNSFIQNM